MDLLETYLREQYEIRSSGAGVRETSYYPALANLLNEVGKSLKPRVRCILQLANRGAGSPDGGLFTPDQLQKAAETGPLPGQTPARGVIEVKGTGDDAWVVAEGQQVSRYWGKYRQVLVTNYRDFVLVGQDAEGNPTKLETYRLADGEAHFWAATAHPHQTAQQHGERFVEYLRRVMLYGAPLAAPEDVAWFLASYARDAKARIERSDLPALAAVRTALEEALGLQFDGEKGDHFFRSTLVQTLFYGVFSAWVLWSRQHPPASKALFNWHETSWFLRVPMIRALFDQVATPSKLGPLGLVECLDWTAAALNRVDRASFFTRFEEGHAVQYFYEPFLQAFDPELRKDLGVWYTPPEIVQYMVARVDTVLREELDIEDGLADPRVYVLDPCCGTGAYLVEVLRRIHMTLKEKGQDALSADDLKRAAVERVFGFEILPAPFVVAHLQLGLLLQNLGAPLSDRTDERAGVYLTNALTGWEPTERAYGQLPFPGLIEERIAADRVKQVKPILVVLGNPPYNAFAGVSPREEKGLVEPYKDGLISEWGIKKFNLDDLYVRFFRLAERRIAEMTGKGVVCYISNHSWISDPSFVVLRKHLLASFDRFWIDNMHGNRKISEYAPDGRTSETIFAIPGFSVGIQQGVAISLWVKSAKKGTAGPHVLFRDDLDAARAGERRAQLLDSLKAKRFDAQYEPANPAKDNRFSFRPSDVGIDYGAWPRLVELCAEGPYQGLSEDRRKALIDAVKESLRTRMERYFDKTVSWEAFKSTSRQLTESYVDFPAEEVRTAVLRAETFDAAGIRRYAMRPFDTQYCYYTPFRPIWRRHRPEFFRQAAQGNAFIASRFNRSKDPEGPPMEYTTGLCDYHYLTPNVGAIPLRLYPSQAKRDYAAQTTFLADIPSPNLSPIANLSVASRDYLTKLGILDPDADAQTARLIWMHVLAIGYSPAYLVENSDGIRQDWPRVPLPNSKEAVLRSAGLGRQIAALLDTESPVSGVTSGAIRPELRLIGPIARVGGGALNPDAGDLAVTAGWGHAGKGGVTMPAKGRIVERDYTPDERAAIAQGAGALGLTPEEALAHLGETTRDVYLNEVAYWRNVPAGVWEYTIGGYQVMKKWLSYREQELLGRPLAVSEVREVTNMARRIAAILLLEPALDANYLAIKDESFPWHAAAGPETGG